MANAWGGVKQHRLVMECLIGRLLEPHEIVHHRNRNRRNNRPANLELLASLSDHGREHADDTRRNCAVPLTEEQVRRALDGRTTLQAAKFLGVHHMTLRNRFEHLLKKRRSPGAEVPADVLAKIRQLAADPSMTQEESGLVLGMSAWAIHECCVRNSIQWVAGPKGTPSHRSYKEACAMRSPSMTQLGP
jgi:hypothetical protein